MSRSRTVRTLLLLLAGALVSGAAARPAAAQSILARTGLGFASEPLDARARALGGVGLGLPEANLSLVNPAGIVALPAPALHVTYQADRFSNDIGGAHESGTTARFPLMHVALPLGERWAVSLGYGSLLDRHWAVETNDSLTLGGQRLPVRDRFVSRGGVAKFRAGAAHRFGEKFGVGVALDVHTGSVRDSLSREFGAPCGTSGSGVVTPLCESTVRDFRGVGVSAGARWTPSEAVALAAAVSSGGTLTAKTRTDSTAVTEERVDLPLTLSAGGSARVASNTLLALSGQWAGWSSATGTLVGAAGARDVWSVAGGLEWDAIALGERGVPLRLGARYATLPFRWDAQSDWGAERALTGGFGIYLAGGAARTDIGIERGTRGGSDFGVDESFWRLGVSLTVLGR
jgi:hypothetical protein